MIGFTLLEVLVACTLGLLIMSVLFELFLASQRALQVQMALSTLESRLHRVTDILRSDIHRAAGNVRMIDDKLWVNDRVYLTEKNALVMIDANHRKTRLVEEVSHMQAVKYPSYVDVSLQVASGSLRETIHVITSLK